MDRKGFPWQVSGFHTAYYAPPAVDDLIKGVGASHCSLWAMRMAGVNVSSWVPGNALRPTGCRPLVHHRDLLTV